MKTLATTTDLRSRAIVGGVAAEMSDVARASLPRVKNQILQVARERSRMHQRYEKPEDANDLDVDDIMRKADLNLAAPLTSLRVMFDSKVDVIPPFGSPAEGADPDEPHPGGPGRAIILGCPRGIEILQNSEFMYSDGTFKTSPKQFMQIYTFHGDGGSKTDALPCLYACLTVKTQELYTVVFERVKDLLGGHVPTMWTIDFEKGAYNALRAVFGRDLMIRGCNFHLNHAVFARVQRMRLKQRYTSDEVFARDVRCIPAVAFLPTRFALPAFENLMSANSVAAEVKQLGSEWANYWFGPHNAEGRRVNAQFPLSTWSCHDRVVRGVPTTNNSVESYNRSFKHGVGLRPSFLVFLKRVHGEMAIVDAQYTEARVNPVPVQKKTMRHGVKLDRVRNILDRFEQGNYVGGLLECLRDLALVIHLF